MNLGLLRKSRKEKGLSQAALARRLGIAQNTYSQYETGERHPYPEFLPKLADALGLTLDELLRDHPEGAKEITEGATPTTSNENWVEIIRNLSESLKRESDNMRLRIELVEARDAEARVHEAEARKIAEQKQLEAERNLKIALEEARAARLAQAFPLPDDRPDEAAVAEE